MVAEARQWLAETHLLMIPTSRVDRVDRVTQLLLLVQYHTIFVEVVRVEALLVATLLRGLVAETAELFSSPELLQLRIQVAAVEAEAHLVLLRVFRQREALAGRDLWW